MAALGPVRGPDRRKRRLAAQVEPLEGRTLLTDVLIDALNNLSITGSGGNNDLTISVANGTYTFNDPSEVFNVTNNGTATFNGDGSNTLTVSGIIAIDVETADGDDTVNLQSSGVPTTIDTGQGAGDMVNLGSLAPVTGGILSGIVGGLTIDDTSQVNLDDSGDTTGRTVLIGELFGRTIISLPDLGLEEFLVGDSIGSMQFNGGTGDDAFDIGGASTTMVSINGGGGDDALAFEFSPLVSFGTFDGGAGTNTIDYSNATLAGILGVTVNLTTGTASFTDGIANVQNVNGTSGDDTIIGNNQTNTLQGGPGNDMINSEGGAGTPGDFIFGNDGDDTITWDPGDGTDSTDGGAGNNTQIVNRGGGNNTMFVRNSGTDPTHSLFDGTGFTIDMVNVQQLNVQGQGGIDTLTVDFNNGSPFTNLTGIIGGPGINYDGGSEFDQLILQRSGGTYSANNEIYRASGPGAGTISLDDGDIAFSSLDPIQDTVPATSFTFNAPANDPEIDIFDGPVVSTFQTTEIVSPTSDFELIDFANKTNVTINSGNPDQTLLIDNSKAAAGLASLTINTAAGPDQVTVTATPPGVAITIFTFAGDDSVSVAGAGVAAGTTLTINGGIGFNTLHYDGGGGVVTVTPGGGGQLTIARAGSGSVVLQSFDQVTIVDAIATAPVPGAPVTFTAVEGLNLVDVVVATFTSGGTGARADDFGATINWGDGTSSAGVIVQDASDPTVFYVQGSHLYADDGPFTTTTTLRTLGGVTTTFIGSLPVTIAFGPSAPVNVGGTATVGDAPIVSQGTPVVGVEGSPPTAGLVATFQTIDPNATAAGFAASIDWGDETTSAGTIGVVGALSDGVTLQVTGTHVYTDEGTYPVTVTITSVGGSTAVSGTTAVIGDAPIELVSFVAPLATAGTPLGPISLATFRTTDPNATSGEFTAEIVWGDGTSSPGVVTVEDLGFLAVEAVHTFAAPGSYEGTVQIRSNGGATASAPVGSTVVGLAATFPAVSATEEVPLNNVVLATISSDGGPAIDPRRYTATIDWGDASAITSGFIDPLTRNVRGSHTYEESGAYTVRITVGTFENPGLAVFSRTIAVASVPIVPIVLAGQLEPASDSGVSDSDRITFVRQPTYFGTSEDLSRITLSAQSTAGGAAIPLGGTTADANGNWQLTSQAALPDGQYTITSTAVDRNGVTTASASLGTLVIDTVGPRVSALGFVQSPGRLLLQFQDDRSGLAQRPLTDGRNYRVEKPRLRPGRLLVRDLSVSLPTGPTDPQTVTAPLTRNGRRNLRGGTFTVTVFNSDLGITDVAGNPLDGEFFGRFPSGNGVPGGDFLAVVNALRNRILAVGPSQQGTPIRNNPGAIPGVVLPTREQLTAAARKKRQEAQQAKVQAAHAKALAAQRAARSSNLASRNRHRAPQSRSTPWRAPLSSGFKSLADAITRSAVMRLATAPPDPTD